jgi:hypothetical protein
MSPSRRAWLALAPVPAAAVGAAAAHASGVPLEAFAPNAVALGLGAGAYLVLTRASSTLSPRVMTWGPVVALLAIGATMLAPGIDGVHRWLPLGPFRLNVSAAVLPWLLGGLVTAGESGRPAVLALVGAAQLIHLAQPDAAQATALALGALPVFPFLRFLRSLAFDDFPRAGLLGVALFVVAALAWERRDPLPGVPHVEGILAVIAARGPAWIAGAALAAVALFAPGLAALFSPDRSTALLGESMTLALGGAFGVAALSGRYPLPVFGAGAGPILGWWAWAILLGRRRWV